jgi:hypothetical protein
MRMLLWSLLWTHLLSLIGIFGGLLALRAGLPADVRNRPDVARGAAKLFNILLGIGLLAGVGLYIMTHGYARGAHVNGVIGVKMVLLLGVGAMVAMSGKPGKGDTFRTIAMVLIALAAFCGLTLPSAIP